MLTELCSSLFGCYCQESSGISCHLRSIPWLNEGRRVASSRRCSGVECGLFNLQAVPTSAPEVTQVQGLLSCCRCQMWTCLDLGSLTERVGVLLRGCAALAVPALTSAQCAVCGAGGSRAGSAGHGGQWVTTAFSLLRCLFVK